MAILWAYLIATRRGSSVHHSCEVEGNVRCRGPAFPHRKPSFQHHCPGTCYFIKIHTFILTFTFCSLQYTALTSTLHPHPQNHPQRNRGSRIEACRAAFHDFEICRMDTRRYLGEERGVMLIGGQKVSYSRARFADPSVLFLG
jgi:hypothetical protein